MGCWNETCALTNLPIRAGDSIVAFIGVTGVGTGSNVSYQFDYGEFTVMPLTPVMYGEYDDYGRIDSIKSPNIEKTVLMVLTEYFNRKILVQEEKESFKPELLEAINRGEVKYISDDGEYKLSLIMMHQYAYDALVEYQGNRTIRIHDHTSNKFKNQKVNTYVKEKFQSYEKYMMAREAYIKNPIPENAPDPSLNTFMMQDHYGVYQILEHLENTQADKRIRQLWYKDIMSLYILYIAMTEGRMTFRTRVGAGSQADSVKVQEKLARLTLELIGSRKKEED